MLLREWLFGGGMSYIEGKRLKEHDFNEPQKGKDQCDRESAVPQHCRTVYISAGHNIQTVEDIENSLPYMNAVKNATVSIVEIDSSVNEIKSQKIDNIIVIIILLSLKIIKFVFGITTMLKKV